MSALRSLSSFRHPGFAGLSRPRQRSHRVRSEIPPKRLLLRQRRAPAPGTARCAHWPGPGPRRRWPDSSGSGRMLPAEPSAACSRGNTRNRGRSRRGPPRPRRIDVPAAHTSGLVRDDLGRANHLRRTRSLPRRQMDLSGRLLDANGRARIPGTLREPTRGLEARTPSLRVMFRRATSVHARHRSGTNSLQTTRTRTVRR